MSKYVMPLMESFMNHVEFALMPDKREAVNNTLKEAIDHNNLFHVLNREMLIESGFNTLAQLESVFRSSMCRSVIWALSVDDFIIIPNISSYADYGKYIMKKYFPKDIYNFIDKIDNFEGLGYDMLEMLDPETVIFNKEDNELMILKTNDEYNEREMLEELELL